MLTKYYIFQGTEGNGMNFCGCKHYGFIICVTQELSWNHHHMSHLPMNTDFEYVLNNTLVI